MKAPKVYLDSIGNEVKEGDWVSYLVPQSRKLNIGTVVGGTEKSLRLIELDFYQLGRHRFSQELTLTREFKLCVKIDPPIDRILKHAHKSMFCHGVWASASGLDLQQAFANSVNIHTDFKSHFSYYSANEVEEIRERGISAGWYWHQEHVKK